MEKKYWKSIEELNDLPDKNPGKQDEDSSKSLLELIDEEISQKPSSRRNFLKFCGFSFATAAIAGSCKNPVNKAIPFLISPEVLTPGMASYYASTYFDGHEYESILVKVRDGRPIKIEGNNLSTISQGGTNARVQGSVLSLYDDGSRFKAPMKEGNPSTWEITDREMISKLTAINAGNKEIVILSSPIISPTTMQVITDFRKKYPKTRHVIYDPVSMSGTLQANLDTFGTAAIPDYHFEKASVIVSFGADFLGTWLMPAEFSRRFAETRRLSDEKRQMSQLHVFESTLSLSGCNADRRYPIKPGQQAAYILNLYNLVAGLTGGKPFPAPAISGDLSPLAQKLVKAKGKSLVICGMNDPALQTIVNAINMMLGSYGTTIDLGTTVNFKQAMDQDMENLVAGMKKGAIGALILYNANPVYDYYDPSGFREGLHKVELTVSMANARDETSALVTYVCPDHHFLESWNDAEPKRGIYSLQQPVINPVYVTRQAQESLLKWAGIDSDYHGYLNRYWIDNFYGKQDKFRRTDDFWDHVLQEGVFEPAVSDWSLPSFNQASVTAAAIAANTAANAVKPDDLEVILYETIALGNGRHANNPWMMEMPDPVSKVCWDNFIAISVKDADRKGLVNGDVVKIEGVSLPVYIQPGQAENTIGIAYGYGRTNTGKVADHTGANVFHMAITEKGCRKYHKSGVTLTTTGGKYGLASTQTHHSMEGRDIVRDSTYEEWIKKPNAGNEKHEEYEKSAVTLYKEVKFEGHHWGMAIDLNTCSGCSACVIGCQAENNIPVIGKEQVAKTRIMHWIRIDRYYSDDPGNPAVYFQPVMCQQCDNAPCENVCPVSATNHSSEGLNQMAYNRCIGTKYCINNCPYKVRRFNWFRYATNAAFDYNMNSDLGRMVLNPDVTVRERGVVEKCSFCVQRIQEKKLKAKVEGRLLADNEIMPACAQACPSKAIVFGDLTDPESKISKIYADERNYYLLEELHTLPTVGYLTRIRNSGKKESET